MASAPIELSNVETGGLYQVATSATGNYVFNQIPVGTYQMTLAVPGFKTYIRQNLRVQTATTLREDITLEVGANTESVTVTAEASLLRTESGELSTNVTTDRLNNLPILGVGSQTSSSHGVRNPLAAAQLQNGVYFLPNNTMRVNGAPSNTMAIRVDGQDATNGVVTFAQAQAQPGVDALEEVAIQTSNYAAEFGQAGSGLFNFTTRSGTNAYHGSVYDYFVNEALWAAQPYNHIKPIQRRNDYGGTIGGPIKIPGVYDGHDRSFFFFNYEEFREKITINTLVQTMPIQAYREGDFSGILGRTIPGITTDSLGNQIREGMIFDPLSETLAPDGTRSRTQFVGNRIPLVRMDRSALKVQNFIPLPNLNENLINNWVQPYVSNRVTPIPSLKLDHNLSDKLKASFYWSTTETAVQRCTPLCGTVGLPEPIDNSRGTFIESYTLRANFDYTLSPTMLLHVGLGYMNVDFKDTAPIVGYDMLTELGISGSSNPSQARFPQFTGLNGPQSLGGMGPSMGPGGQVRSTENKPTGNISLSWVRGDHNLKFGSEIRIEGYPVQNFTALNGAFAFNTAQTTSPYLLGRGLSGRFVGFPYASFLLGRPNTTTLNALPAGKAGRQFWSWFVQDNWKATRKLTLDIGLRWDLFTAPVEQYGRTPSFSPTLPNPSAGGHPGATIFEADCNCTFSQNYKYAYQPRLGAAYQLDNKTVLRAGLGISYSMSQGSFGQTGTGAGASQSLTSPTFADPSMVLSNGIPFSVSWPQLTPGLFPLIGTTSGAPPWVDTNLGRPARQWQYQVGIQREVFANLVLEASYVGNRGVWWKTDDLTDLNALQPGILQSAFGLNWEGSQADRNILRAQLNSPAAGRFQNAFPYNGFPASATVAQSLRPFPQFTNIGQSGGPLGKTWFDSFQFKATKRLSQGLDLTFNYTYSKELQLGTENDGGGGTSNDVFNRNINKQFSTFSRPHFAILTANYTLQKYFGNRWLNTALADWSIGAVLQYGSGRPIPAPANIANTNNNTLLRGNSWSTRVPGQPLYLENIDCHCYDPATTVILNPDAWTDTPDGQFSPSARYFNDFRYRRNPQELMSIARNFNFREGVTLTIRAEFNNVFNRPNNPNPGTNRGQALRTDSSGRYTAGFGTINTTGNVADQRQGTIVARLRF